VEVGADISEVYTASVFLVEVCKVGEFLRIYRILYFGERKESRILVPNQDQ
jgi:hypothetical protein